jgi:hypothetical protein
VLRAHGYTFEVQPALRVPYSHFGRVAWSLESNAVDALPAKIRWNGVPLAEDAGGKPYRGTLTGFNETFLVDTPTKERLAREDPRCVELLRPYRRGQDVKCWSPDWAGIWMIVLKSSGDHPWPWREAGEDAETVFRQTYPSLYAHM